METAISTGLRQADAARIEASQALDPAQRSKLGQFMTPAPVAMFMAGMFDALPQNIRLLDPGAGVGALTAAFVHRICSGRKKPKSIEVTAFEVDAALRGYLAETMKTCAAECKKVGIAFAHHIIADDYIVHASEPLLSEHSEQEQYDCAILNPPYAKINTSSHTRRALSSMGIETSNLYTAFVAVALDQLKSGGQLVAITPRSFCNGLYFEPFRRFLLEHAALRKIHLYESRTHAFKDDEVLQENIIYQLVKSRAQPKNVRISLSQGPHELRASSREVPFDQVVLPNDSNRFIHLAVSDEDTELARRVRSLPCRLGELELSVSTGRVVDFRAREFLRKSPSAGAVPLIYPCHFNGGYVAWPKLDARKPNALVSDSKTSSLMVPRGIYVLTKRFSSKEQKRRLMAVIYDPKRIDADFVGFENHLNYFHANGRGMVAALARGLTLFLNSTAVDQYFRQFSGHTQVNATDLRNLHYPKKSDLELIGRQFKGTLPEQARIDEIVEGLL